MYSNKVCVCVCVCECMYACTSKSNIAGVLEQQHTMVAFIPLPLWG